MCGLGEDMERTEEKKLFKSTTEQLIKRKLRIQIGEEEHFFYIILTKTSSKWKFKTVDFKFDSSRVLEGYTLNQWRALSEVYGEIKTILTDLNKGE